MDDKGRRWTTEPAQTISSPGALGSGEPKNGPRPIYNLNMLIK